MSEDVSSAVLERIVQDGRLDAGDFGRLAWITHVGHVRSRNEDRLLVSSPWGGRFLLALVADGAGGHDAGDKAAELVASTLHEAFPEDGDPPDGDPGAWLDAAIHRAHERVTALGTGSARPPASTAVGLLLEKETQALWRFHVGDSRIYAQDGDGNAEPWTRDHNIINGLIDRGLPVDQAMKIAEGGRLTQVVGGAARPELEIEGPFALPSGVTLAILSDGAYAYHLKVEGFTDALDRGTGSPQDRCVSLRESVLAGPAPDNLTAVLWDVPEDLPSPPRSRTMVERTLGGPDAIAPAEGLPLKEPWDYVQQQLEPDVSISGDLPGASTDDTLDPYDFPDADSPRPGAGFGTFLAVSLGLFLVIAFLRLQQDDEYPRPIITPTPAAPVSAATPTPPPEPTPHPTPEVDAAVAALDADWWASLGSEGRAPRRAALAALYGAPLPSTVLQVPVTATSAPSPHEFVDWPQAGGEGAQRVATRWAAAQTLAGTYPVVAAVPAVAERMRTVSCEATMVDWPRVKGVAGDGSNLANYLAGCLVGEGDTVSVRLGDWPHKGWTLTDLDALMTAAAKPGGEAVLSLPDGGGNERLKELGMLASALGDDRLVDVQVEVVLHLPDRARSSAEPDGPATAEALERLVRAASSGGDGLTATAVEGDGLVEFPAGEVTEALSQRVADMNRRVEVTLFRPSSLELEDETAPEAAASPTPEAASAPVPEATSLPSPDPTPTVEPSTDATPASE